MNNGRCCRASHKQPRVSSSDTPMMVQRGDIGKPNILRTQPAVEQAPPTVIIIILILNIIVCCVLGRNAGVCVSGISRRQWCIVI